MAKVNVVGGISFENCEEDLRKPKPEIVQKMIKISNNLHYELFRWIKSLNYKPYPEKYFIQHNWNA
jgi:hypothetical protein